MSSENLVLLSVENHIAKVTLNRPEKLNALSIDMFDALIKVGRQIAEDESIRCVILNANGPSFCSGLDLANFSPDPNAEMNKDLTIREFEDCNKWQKAVWVWHECPVPVIAVGQGVIYGGGLQIFSAADIKFVHPESTLCILEMRWGIIPDMGGTQLWPLSVRMDILKELCYTNRKFSANEAVDYGFATHLSQDPLADAMTLAEQIASKSPSAIVQAKYVLNKAPYLSEADGLMLESEAQQAIIRKENQMEAIFSQMQKRPASFSPFRRPTS